MKRPIRLISVLAGIASMLAVLAVAQPAAAADPDPAFPECGRTITNADNAKTITVFPGTCAALSLDTTEVWDTPASSSGAVRVYDHETFVPDQKWGLAFDRPGSATITSTGVPDCDPGVVCPLYIRTFTVHINVMGFAAARAA